MPTAEEIHESIYEARNAIRGGAYSKLQTRLVVSYLGVTKRLREKLNAGEYSRDEYESILNQVKSAISRWHDATAKNVRKASFDVIDQVGEQYAQSIQQINKEYDIELSINLNGFNSKAYEAMFIRRGLGLSENFKTLGNFGVQDMANEIDDLLVNGIRDGRSWQALQQDLSNKLAMGGRGDLGDMLDKFNRGAELPDDELKQVRRIMFNARRIAVSEINNAYHEASRLGAERSPVVKAKKWNTSGRHDGLFSSPDVCDVLEEGDFHDLGAGVYNCETLPAMPHPQCGCYTTDVLREPEEWGQPKPAVKEPQSASQQKTEAIMKQFEDARSPTLTPNYIDRQTKELNTVLNNGYKYHKARSEQNSSAA